MPKLLEAIAHAKKYLIPFRDTHPALVNQAAGLLAFPPRCDVTNGYHPSSVEEECPYSSLYSPARWTTLADLFVKTHNDLLGLPSSPLLHIALSSGLSALKTPACHGWNKDMPSQPSRSMSLTSSVCPICSTELNELARHVPYAQHSKSHVEHDLLLLPNGRVYGKARLDEYAAKTNIPQALVKDLLTGELYPRDKLKKVFIT